MTFIENVGQADLGVTYYGEKSISNTSQLYLYINPLNSDITKMNDDVFQFSSQITKYINIVSIKLESTLLSQLNKENIVTTIDRSLIDVEDYIYSEEKHRDIFNNLLDKGMSLYLFNMQCQLNISLHILDNLISEYLLKYRNQLLIYYYSVQALYFVYNDKQAELPKELKTSINTIINTHRNIFIKKHSETIFFIIICLKTLALL